MPYRVGAAIRPRDLDSGQLFTVVKGARAAGCHADAIAMLDESEDRRRRAVGASAVPSLVALDAVMALPLGVPVRVSGLSDLVVRRLGKAGPGAVEIDSDWVTRRLTPPLTVAAAVISAPRWSQALVACQAFAGLSQRIVVVDEDPPASSMLCCEADVAGVGVWVRRGDSFEEVLAPARFERRFWKPAAWSFAEFAYAQWLKATGRQASLTGAPSRPSRTARATRGPHQLALPSM